MSKIEEDKTICSVCATETVLGVKCKQCGNKETYYLIDGTDWYFVKKTSGMM